MVVDDRVVTLFIVGDIANNAPGIVTHMLQGRTYEKPPINALEAVRAYLKKDGYKCIAPGEEATNVVFYSGFTGDGDPRQKVKLFVPTAIEIWSKPEPKPFVPAPGKILTVENRPPWKCPDCGTMNADEVHTCTKCDYLRPDLPAPKPQPRSTGTCLNCGEPDPSPLGCKNCGFRMD